MPNSFIKVIQNWFDMTTSWGEDQCLILRLNAKNSSDLGCVYECLVLFYFNK